MRRQLEVWHKQREQDAAGDQVRVKDSKSGEDQKTKVDASFVSQDDTVAFTTKNLKEVNQKPEEFYCDTYVFKERNDDY